MKAAFLTIACVLIVMQVAATPTVWRCTVSHGNWWKPWGKAHCELEGWRSLGRSAASLARP